MLYMELPGKKWWAEGRANDCRWMKCLANGSANGFLSGWGEDYGWPITGPDSLLLAGAQ